MKEIREVTKEIRKFANPARAKASAHILNTKSLKLFGLTVPQVRTVLKKGFSFSDLPHKEQRKVWDKIVKSSDIFEVRSLAFIYYESRIKKLEKSDWTLLKTWMKYVENWEHADRYAKVLAQLFEQYPTLLLPTLKKWNGSKNLWERRLSVVSLFCYQQLRKKQPEKNIVFSLIEPLIHDKEPYVQKGVGWQLREASQVYYKDTYAFLEKYIKTLPAIVFSYSTEKLPKPAKARLKKLRK